jgi:hypothetical protein
VLYLFPDSNMPARTRLSTSQEGALIALDKAIRATRYPDPQDQRDFLDKQASTVVSFLRYPTRRCVSHIIPSWSSAPNCGLLSTNEWLGR